MENKLKDAQQKLEDMNLKFENVSKEKQDLLDKNKESKLVEITDLELYLGEDLAIPMVDFSEQDLKEERNAEFGITIADDPRLFE